MNVLSRAYGGIFGEQTARVLQGYQQYFPWTLVFSLRQDAIMSWWFQPNWKNISQNGNLPQVGMKIKIFEIWNHLVFLVICEPRNVTILVVTSNCILGGVDPTSTLCCPGGIIYINIFGISMFTPKKKSELTPTNPTKNIQDLLLQNRRRSELFVIQVGGPSLMLSAAPDCWGWWGLCCSADAQLKRLKRDPLRPLTWPCAVK